MKPMLYLWKGLLILAAVTAAVLLLKFALSDLVQKSESQLVYQQVSRVEKLINEQQIEAEKMAVRWAEKSIISDLLLKNTQKNRKKVLRSLRNSHDNIVFIYLLDKKQKVILAKSKHYNSPSINSMDKKIVYELKKKHFKQYIEAEEVIKDLIFTNGLISVVVTPVYKNSASEKVIGHLLVGSKISREQVKLSTGRDYEYEKINRVLMPAQQHRLNHLDKNNYISLKDETSARSYYLIKNKKGDALVFIKTQYKGIGTLELFKQSWLSVLIVLSLGLILGYSYWSVKKHKVKRLVDKLETDIAGVQVGAELSGRVSSDKRDILGGIVNQINQKFGGFEEKLGSNHIDNRKYDAEIILNELPLEAYLKDSELKYIAANTRYCESVGIEQEQLIGKSDPELDITGYLGQSDLNERKVINQKITLEYEEHIKTPLGGEKIYNTHLIPFLNKKGVVEGVVGVKIDIGRIKLADEEMEMAAKVLENTAEGVMVTNADRRIIHVNAAYTEMTGYHEEELLGKIPLLLQPESRSKTYQEIQSNLEAGGSWKGELWSSRKNGSNFPEFLSIKTIKNKEGVITNYFSMSNDVSEQKALEEKLYQMAHYDGLTELPNRTLFKDRLKQQLIRCQRDKKSIGVLFLDLDLFKSINDSLGHAAGDELLKIVSKRLTMTLRGTDSIARLGGDEFTILVPDLDGDEEKNSAYLAQICEKVSDVIRQPMMIEKREIKVTCSIGVTVFPKDATNVDELLRNADSAMYYAKEQGRRSFQFYSKEFNERAVWRLEKEIELRSALKENRLEVYYQPQVDVISRHVVGAEALLRWMKKGEVVLGPEKIIALAEETGMINDLGNWILRQACVECKKWQVSGHKNLRVAVNLSAKQFKQKNLVAIVENILEETGLPGKLLELEVTESSLMHDVGYSIEMMDGLSKRGVRWSLDDFGTGYSSLTYLRDFPVHVLKVDQSFVKEITISPEDAAIVDVIIDLAHRLHLTVIAEGVESEEQLKVLGRMGCEQVQGYYFSKPLTTAAFQAYLSDGVGV